MLLIFVLGSFGLRKHKIHKKNLSADDSDSSLAEDDDDVEIEGFNFAVLRRRFPNVSSELTDFRNYLIDSTNEMTPMKVWQLQDLSFQVRNLVNTSQSGLHVKFLSPDCNLQS